MKVLFVNHRQERCGVYQFGKRIYELSKNSKKVQYTYIEVESEREFASHLSHVNPDVILYNWYPVTMGWLSEQWVASAKGAKHYFIFHDGNVRQNFDKYLFSGAEGKDINFPKEKTAILPRPLFTYNGEYPNNSVLTVGSFGFGGWHKGFVRLVNMINIVFNEAVINIQMPFAYYGDRDGTETRKIAAECHKYNTNPGVTLNINHEFLSNEDTLEFLSKNDINVFLYSSENQGLSSVIDYALSVKRPITITNDSMFKHIYKKQIDVDETPLIEIVRNGINPLKEFYNKWNPENFSIEMDKIYDIQ
jgi:hypothetical protein